MLYNERQHSSLGTHFNYLVMTSMVLLKQNPISQQDINSWTLQFLFVFASYESVKLTKEHGFTHLPIYYYAIAKNLSYILQICILYYVGLQKFVFWKAGDYLLQSTKEKSLKIICSLILIKLSLVHTQNYPLHFYLHVNKPIRDLRKIQIQKINV